MKTKQAIKLAGTRTALARLLGVSIQATYNWPVSLPELRVYQLRCLKPDWFAVH